MKSYIFEIIKETEQPVDNVTIEIDCNSTVVKSE
jgi:hypothetical protein